MAANELARGHEWGGEYTQEEREMGIENVNTGLRRGLDEEDGDEEEEVEGNGMEISDDKAKDPARTGPEKGKGIDNASVAEASNPLPLEQVLKFLAIGVEPQR